MKFVLTIKQAVAKFFRAIISEEVSKVDAQLQRERNEIHTHLQVFAAQLAAFNKAVSALSEVVQQLESVKENNTLREHIKELHGYVTSVGDTLKQLHPTT